MTMARDTETPREYVERRLEDEDYGVRIEILRAAEDQFGKYAPSKTTFYRWLKEWDLAHPADRGEQWSLFNDSTGRPDVVLRVLAALAGRSRRPRTVSIHEAQLLVRLATAAPKLLRDTVTETRRGSYPAWGALSLWRWASRYLSAESRGDLDELALLDFDLATLYVTDGYHFQEARRHDGQTLEELYADIGLPPALEQLVRDGEAKLATASSVKE